MKIDVLARAWGSETGGPNGMAIAAAYLGHTLSALGHEVRPLAAYEDASADLVITTCAPTWRRTVAAARKAGALGRLAYWHHAGGVPEGHDGVLLAPPAVETPASGWARRVVLPPSSWPAEAGGARTGSEILVAGAGPAKGGHVAFAVARRCTDLRWYVLRGRSASSDLAPWLSLPHATLAAGMVEPWHFLARARAVLAPTRFEVHPLLLVEAAVRGIPIVCTDLPSTRAAAGDVATYVPMTAPVEAWEADLRASLDRRPERLRLRPYVDVVRDALVEVQGGRAAA